MKRRFLAILLSLTLCFGCTPVHALTEEPMIGQITEEAEAIVETEKPTDEAAEAVTEAVEADTPETAQEIQAGETEETDVSLPMDAKLMSGQAGYTASYLLSSNDDGTFTLAISGTGAIFDDEPANRAWNPYVKRITEVTIADGITGIGAYSFSGMENLKTITIPKTVSAIGDQAFDKCKSLEKIIYAGTQEEWQRIACTDFGALTMLYSLSNTITLTGSCGEHASYQLIPDQDANFELKITGSGDMQGYLETDRAPWNVYARYIRRISVEEGITSISRFAFFNIRSVDRISIPKSVTKVDINAFITVESINELVYAGTAADWAKISFTFGNTALTDFYEIQNGISRDEYDEFEDYTYKITGNSHDGVRLEISASGDLYSWSNAIDPYVTELVLNEGITYISDTCFTDMPRLKKITIPTSVEVIEADFLTCDKQLQVVYAGSSEDWEAIDIDNYTTVLEKAYCRSYDYSIPGLSYYNSSYFLNLKSDNTFELEIFGAGLVGYFYPDFGKYTEEITSIVFSEGITAIDEDFVFSSPYITCIQLPKSLRMIDYYSFEEYYGLEEVRYNGTPEDWKKIQISEGNDILKVAYWCSNGIEISGSCGTDVRFSLKSVDGRSFRLVISGTGAMEDYEHAYVTPWSVVGYLIESVVTEDGITHIGDYAFAYTAMYELSIPDSVQSIGEQACYTDTLQAVTIPTSVKTIEEDAFYPKLMYVRYTGSVLEWREIDNACPMEVALVEYDYREITGPVIKEQPQNVSAGIKGNASFHIVAGNAAGYQWQYSKNSGAKWINCSASGNNTDTLTVSVSESNKVNIYRCLVKGSDGSQVISETATVDLIPGVVILQNPKSGIAAIGEVADFTIIAENAASYQWQYSKDGAHWYNSNAAGNKTDTLHVTGAQNSQGNRYRCVVLGIDGNKKKSLACAMIVLKQVPQTSYAKVGETATFSLKAEGIATYLWQYSKDGGATWYKSGATGCNTDTVSFKVTESNKTMLYRCKLTTPDEAYAATKPVGFGTVLKIIRQPSNITIPKESSIVFSIEAEGVASYQWQRQASQTIGWVDVQEMYGGKTARMEMPYALAYVNSTGFRCKLTGVDGKVIYSNIATVEVQ